jgi:multidrug resistance efflux pump
MKKLILTLGACLVGFGLFAADVTPELQVAQIDSLAAGILKMHVALGEKVKKGQLIFELDSNLLDVATMKAENNVRYCKQIYDRDQKLLKTHNVSLELFQKARYNYINAVAGLKTALINVKNCYYYAPFDGNVTKIINYTGSAVGDGNEIIDITRDPNDKTSNTTPIPKGVPKFIPAQEQVSK